MQEFNLRQKLGEFAQSIALKAQEKGLEIVLDLSNIPQPWVKGDWGRLQQIFINLVSNAIKFTTTGEILIQGAVTPQGDRLCFQGIVRDTGCGIPEDKFASLFDAFTQVDASITRKYGGTGLGLAIVKKLCELMDGGIQVSSEVGHGTQFEFTVQLEPSEQVVFSEQSPSLPLNQLKILIVDNHHTQRGVITRQLEMWGANVTSIEDGNKVISLCEQELELGGSDYTPFDLVLINMDISQINAFTLGRQLKNNGAFTPMPLILMVPMNSQPKTDTFEALGFAKCLQKPITPDILLNTISMFSPVSSTGELTPEFSKSSDTKQANESNISADLNENSSLQVLLVEDNNVNKVVAKAMLKKLGLSVDVASNGKEALEMLNRSVDNIDYSIIFMDCQMPEMDGFETTRQIRSGTAGVEYRTIPIIAMTASAFQEDQRKCMESGMDDYLAKPIKKNTLRAILEKWSNEL